MADDARRFGRTASHSPAIGWPKADVRAEAGSEFWASDPLATGSVF